MAFDELISLHIRSMWETICDALASWSGWKFGSKIPVYPILGFGHQHPPPTLRLFTFDLPRIPPPPSPENWNLGRSWHFKTFQFWLAQKPHPHPPPPPPTISPKYGRWYVETNLYAPWIPSSWIQWIMTRVQKYHCYQIYSMSDNRYIPMCSNKVIKQFLSLPARTGHQGKVWWKKFSPGQGIVREFCKMSGNFDHLTGVGKMSG